MKTKKILLMGRDNKLIHFLYIEDIKKVEEIKGKIQTKICEKDLSYMDSLLILLQLRKTEKHSPFIANKRYRMLKIRDVEFLDTTPNFNDVFCTK